MPAEIPFSELVDVNPRRPLSRGQRYPYVEMAAVPEGGGRPTHHEEREFTGGGSKFAVGDTLFARITPCTENGKLAYVDGLPVGDIGFGSTELIVLAAKPGKADPRFVYQVAASGRVRERAISRMLGTSGRQRVPTWYFTEELTVPDIPLPEQRAIATVLDTVDDTIERTEAVTAATEELRRALLHELLTRGVPGLHSEWKHAPGLGTVPACWDVTTLGEVCERPQYGAGASAIPYDPRLPRYVRITDLTDDGRLRADEPRSADPTETAGYELQPGDLLFARSGATVGKTYLHRREDGLCVFAGYLIRFRAKSESVTSDFLELWTRTGFYERWVASMFRAGAQPNINAAEYASLPVAIPDRGEQDRIVDVLAAIREHVHALRESQARLVVAKAGLSDELLSGRTRTRRGALT